MLVTTIYLQLKFQISLYASPELLENLLGLKMAQLETLEAKVSVTTIETFTLQFNLPKNILKYQDELSM
jgi:hypothetical protein